MITNFPAAASQISKLITGEFALERFRFHLTEYQRAKDEVADARQQIMAERQKYRKELPPESKLRDFLKGFREARKKELIWDEPQGERHPASYFIVRMDEYIDSKQREARENADFEPVEYKGITVHWTECDEITRATATEEQWKTIIGEWVQKGKAIRVKQDQDGKMCVVEKPPWVSEEGCWMPPDAPLPPDPDLLIFPPGEDGAGVTADWDASLTAAYVLLTTINDNTPNSIVINNGILADEKAKGLWLRVENMYAKHPDQVEDALIRVGEDLANLKPSKPNQGGNIPEGARSIPMSKTEIASRYRGLDSVRPREAKLWMAEHDLRAEPGNKWTVSLEGLDESTRKRLTATG